MSFRITPCRVDLRGWGIKPCLLTGHPVPHLHRVLGHHAAVQKVFRWFLHLGSPTGNRTPVSRSTVWCDGRYTTGLYKLPSVTSSFILTDHFIEAVTEYTHSPLTTIWGYRIGGRRCFAFRHTILPTFSTFLYRNKVYAVSQRIFESDFLLACIWNQYYYWILILIIASALDSVWIPRNLV